PSDERLRDFFIHQIETDVSDVYGGGFRAARAAYLAVGLEELLEHVRVHRAFPVL
ncbi:unnamed protein product, partial [Phaeothamnion confervicola]